MERVDHLIECVQTLDKAIANIQKEKYPKQFEEFRVEVAQNLQEHVDRAAVIDKEVRDLHKEAEISFGIKKEFEELKTAVKEEFDNQVEIIHKQDENIEEIRISANILIDERNQKKDEVDQLTLEVKELKMWRKDFTLKQEEEFYIEEIEIEEEIIIEESEIEEEFNDEEIKIETQTNPETEEDNQEEELIENNYDSEIELQGDSKNQTVYTNAKQQNQEIRFKWFSSAYIPEEYKLQYVQKITSRHNQEVIFEWYRKCVIIDLVPEEFQLVPEDTETEEDTVNQSEKKSFHKRRKEE